jgi:pSer/pThr/pTyr-binding forkhead associated (FHA) protein
MVVGLEFNGEALQSISLADIETDIVIGRSDGCDWQTPRSDRTVSGSHATLYRQGKHVWLRDNDSTRGTTTGAGKKITKVKLSPGDRYNLGSGDCRLLVQAAAAEKKTASGADSVAAGTPVLVLAALAGPMRGRKLPISPGSYLIGSAEDAEFVIEDGHVSRRHARIDCQDDGISYVTDLASRNGVFLNGDRIKADVRHHLQPGDEIKIGKTRLLARDPSKRSRVVPMLVVALLTLAAAGGAYFYQIYHRQPRAEGLVRKAERMAADERFVDAETALAAAENSWDYARHRARVEELRARVPVWAHTHSSWEKAMAQLQAGELAPANQTINQLSARGAEAWSWGASGNIKRTAFEQANTALDSFNTIENALGNLDLPSEDLTRHRDNLQRMLDAFATAAAPPYLEPLLVKIRDSQRRCNELLGELTLLQTLLDRLQTGVPSGDEMIELRRRVEDLLESKHPKVQATAVIILDCLNDLGAALSRYDRARQMLLAVKFDEVRTNIEGRAELDQRCTDQPSFVDFHQKLEGRFQALRDRCEHIEQLHQRCQDVEAALAIIQPDSHLRDPKILTEILRVDCFDNAMPARSQVAGRYGQYLGMTDFLARRAIAVRRVTSKLTACKDALDRLSPFVRVVSEDETLNRGALATLAGQLQQALTHRDATVTDVLEIVRDPEQPRRSRLIAAGIAAELAATPDTIKVDDLPLPEWIRKERLAVLREVAALDDEYDRAETARKVEIIDEVLRVGLPGSGVVRKMWGRKKYE